MLLFSNKITGSSPSMSTVHTSPRDENGTIEVGQGNLRLVYAVKEGKLTHYFNSRSMVSYGICTCNVFMIFLSVFIVLFFFLEHFKSFIPP